MGDRGTCERREDEVAELRLGRPRAFSHRERGAGAVAGNDALLEGAGESGPGGGVDVVDRGRSEGLAGRRAHPFRQVGAKLVEVLGREVGQASAAEGGDQASFAPGSEATPTISGWPLVGSGGPRWETRSGRIGPTRPGYGERPPRRPTGGPGRRRSRPRRRRGRPGSHGRSPPQLGRRRRPHRVFCVCVGAPSEHSAPGAGAMPGDVSWITKQGLGRNYGGPVDRRKRNPRTCDHVGPALVRPANGGLVATCLLCDTVGPERETAEEARRALLDLGEDRLKEG